MGNLPSVTSADTLAQLMSAANSKVKSLKADTTLLLCDYNPRCKPTNDLTQQKGRILPNSLQWFGLKDYYYHQWLGATIAMYLPDEGYAPSTSPTLSLRIRLDLQFRGRLTT